MLKNFTWEFPNERMEKEMKTTSKTTSYIVHSITATVLVLSAQVSMAGSATWLSSPPDSAWENSNNWTAGGPPNGPSDIATFAQSSQTNVNISTSEEVNSIVFTSGCAAYDFSIGACNGVSCQGQLIISGTGVNNNSSVGQNFQAANLGQLIFNNASTAASAHMSIVNGGRLPPEVSTGYTIFNDTSSAAGASIKNFSTEIFFYGDIGRTIFNGASTAAHASISNYGAGGSHGAGGQTIFNDTSTAANASIDNFGSGPASTAGSALTIFNDASTAGHATITNQAGDFAGETIFTGSSTADSATLIANEGSYYATCAIIFDGASTGGTARVKVFGNGYLDISGHQSGVTIGSIDGSGNIFLGANTLTVGTNGINTSFSGVIEGGGSLAKIGSGVLTLKANDCIAGTVGLILVSGSIIKLDFTGPPDVIASLKVNGVRQPPGVYGSATSGAPHQLPEFAGPGTVQVAGAPHITTNPATNLTSSSATLNGTVNPNGLPTTVHFEYGTTTSYGSTTRNQSYNGDSTQNVSANISGLTPNTTYHFRLVGTNVDGTRYGGDRTFTTLAATGPPVVTTNPASLIGSYSARLNGSLDPHGLTTMVYFQYGTTTSYGLTTAPQSQTGSTYRNISVNIGGLTASTTYHFRIVATNSAGTRYGADSTFTTLSATGPPVVVTNPATNVASSSAALNGRVDPHGLITSVYFQYGTTTSYGSTTSSQTKTGNTYQNVSANISGLSPSTAYHFRIVAANSAGTRYGNDRTFTTP
jgi:hypothetical protein